mmetsp:Transcript_65270/g.151456  ORF Transcript_65270/g.151456 Transcript_65270/m.151456 type:complete len:83 (+) Transcript_65270:860-1108(+)
MPRSQLTRQPDQRTFFWKHFMLEFLQQPVRLQSSAASEHSVRDVAAAGGALDASCTGCGCQSFRGRSILQVQGIRGPGRSSS